MLTAKGTYNKVDGARQVTVTMAQVEASVIGEKEMVTAVREYADENYFVDGWDYIVETFSDEEIIECIDTATTIAEAIVNVGYEAKLLNEIREDMQGEAF